MIDWLEIDDGALRYELRNARAGPETLVLIHEMGGCLESWDLALPHLPLDLATLRYDLRGAGQSSKLVGVGELARMIRDLDALLAALGRDGPVALAGGAVGGAVALAYAAARPERAAGVVALGPSIGVPVERRPAVRAHADRIERGGVHAVAEEELARSYPESLRADAERFRRFRARWLGNDPRSYAATYRMLAELEMRDAVAGLAAPALFLAGARDPLRPPAMIEPLAATAPNARFESVDSGHFMATQTPELVAAAIVGFLREIGFGGPQGG